MSALSLNVEVVPKVLKVCLGIGSNIDRESNIKSGIAHLTQNFGPLTLSRVYESKAVGFNGAPFYNMVTSFHTKLPVNAISSILKSIEDDHQRDRSKPSFSPRTLDIDLLLYGDHIIKQKGLLLPRDEILKYAFVLKPLAEINGSAIHPVLRKSYSDIWRDFDKSSQPLKQVTIEFDTKI